MLTNYTESASKNLHSHSAAPAEQNPYANNAPAERLERLLMFLEAQFGSEVSPIARPKIPSKPKAVSMSSGESNGVKIEADEDDDMADSDEDLEKAEAEELLRLHRLGIPVPGVEIKVDKHVATVWLETLEVECSYGLLKARVQAVVERAVETVAPLWVQRATTKVI
jgi:cleavage and polyadenylation specificity factor subunit 3